jgi:hypothetical protein
MGELQSVSCLSEIKHVLLVSDDGLYALDLTTAGEGSQPRQLGKPTRSISAMMAPSSAS